jgi:hypothetical protein
MAKTIGLSVEKTDCLQIPPFIEFSHARLHHDVNILDVCPGRIGNQPLRFADCYANRSADRDELGIVDHPDNHRKLHRKPIPAMRRDRHLGDSLRLLRHQW